MKSKKGEGVPLEVIGKLILSIVVILLMIGVIWIIQNKFAAG